MTRDMHCTRLDPGAVLFRQGGEARRFYFVESGLIKLTRLSVDGEERVIELIRHGGTFAEAVMFMEHKRYPVTAVTVDESVVLGLSNRRLLDLLAQDGHLALRMLGQLSMRMHALVQEIESLSLHDAGYRLVNYFVGECKRSGSTSLTLDAPKRIIASRLGMTPETFSRLVQRLRGQGLIKLEGAVVTIEDLDRLRARLTAE